MISFNGNHQDALKDTEKRKLSGKFEMNFESGEVFIITDDSNCSFDDVLKAFEEIRDEFQRQIDDRRKCPFHKTSSEYKRENK